MLVDRPQLVCVFRVIWSRLAQLAELFGGCPPIFSSLMNPQQFQARLPRDISRRIGVQELLELAHGGRSITGFLGRNCGTQQGASIVRSLRQE